MFPALRYDCGDQLNMGRTVSPDVQQMLLSTWIFVWGNQTVLGSAVSAAAQQPLHMREHLL